MSEIVQGSPEWFAQRCGHVTASRISDVLAKGRGETEAVTRKNYRAQLVAERLTSNVQDGFTNAAMEWGTEQEPKARALYAFYTDVEVIETGMVKHPVLKWAGASPDGLVGDDGLVEIKCPNTSTHIATLLKKKVDNKYIKQMQWQMSCTGRDWCDFVSFDPRMPEDMQLYIQRIPRDAVAVTDMNDAVLQFTREVDEEISVLKSNYALREAS